MADSELETTLVLDVSDDFEEAERQLALIRVDVFKAALEHEEEWTYI